MGAGTDEGLLFEKGLLSDWGGFLFRSVARHKLLALTLFLVALGAGYAASKILPRSYVVKARSLAMPPEGAPGTVAVEGTGTQSKLSQSAANVVLSRASLLHIIRTLNLTEKWDAARSPALKAKDALTSKLFEHPAATEADREEALLGTLEKRLTVSVDDGEAEFAITWPDAASAKDIIDLAQKEFVEARRAAELKPLEERAATLKNELSDTRNAADQAMAQVETETLKRRKGAKASTVRGLQAEGHWRDMPDAALSELRLKILSQRKAITELEETRRRRLAELNAQLADQKASLGPNNPMLLDTKEKIATFEKQASQLETMRAEEQQLVSQFVQRGGKDTDLSADPGPLWPVELNDDPKLTYAKSQLDMEMQHEQSLLRDVSEADVTLASAEAAFPQRYAIVTPATMPSAPVGPSTWKLFLGALVAGFVLALFGSALKDLASGQLKESWQLERTLDVEVLAELDATTAATGNVLIVPEEPLH